MRAEIEQRIKSVYPTGRLWEPSVNEYLGETYDNRIWDILNDVASQTAIQIDANRASEENPRNQYLFTFDADPCFLEWVHLPNKEKLQVIADRGRNVPVFWLSVSKVFPAYDFFYNVWKPRGDTGYLDTEFTYSPFDSDWTIFHNRLFSVLKQAGLEQLPETEWRELVPFVFELEFDDDENDNVEIEHENEGHLVPANVYQCLFGGP
jgi:hypothetical protein